MWNDPIVEEVRKNAQKIENECGNDLHKYFLRLKEHEAKSIHKIISKSELDKRDNEIKLKEKVS